MRIRAGLILVALLMLCTLPARAQDAQREATREQLRATLASYGPKMNVVFSQNDKNPWNFGGSVKTGLKYSDSLEIVANVTTKQTIHISVYPHYKGHYINVLKAHDSLGLAKKLLRFTDTNYLYWGADDEYDVFSGFTFTLESGYPDAAIQTVLASIPGLDEFVGELRPFLD